MDNSLIDLMMHIQNDEMEYFDMFFEKTKRPVFNLIYSYLRDCDESEDILQETYLKMLRYKKKIKLDGNILSYLLQIAKTLSLNYLKRHKREEYIEDIELIGEERKDIPRDLDESPVVKAMKAVLRDSEYQIVILHVVNGMTHKEIASLLKKPLGTITWAYNNAIEKVRRKMG
jgi:RNA polymerase sigma-70 factor (ECF subfamily)